MARARCLEIRPCAFAITSSMTCFLEWVANQSSFFDLVKEDAVLETDRAVDGIVELLGK